MMLHLRPDLVDMSKAIRSVPTWLSRYNHLGLDKAAEFGWLSRDLSASGVAGDPTLATAELGKVQFEQSVDKLVETLAEVGEFNYPGQTL
jgi:creatinine amidohydrolase